jgi:tRNA pseudouridine38-40 synthase
MPRYRVSLEYDGGPFVGWQRQENGPSVQSALETAVHKLSGEQVTVTGAGRTDAGVHALGQVAHFDLTKEFGADKILGALNYHLRPDPVAVLAADVVPAEFHSRFDAIARHYHYRIVCRKPPLVFDHGRAWHVTHKLDAGAMHEGAQMLLGNHDFTTFRAVECQAKSPIKTLDKLNVSSVADEIHIDASARSFLHHQVRSIVGSLKLIGEGKWRPREIGEALAARERARCGPVAPADGLYLVRVDY